MARTKFSELRKEVDARPGAKERLAAKRAATLEALGARLDLVAVFDDEGERRVPIHLGKEPGA